MTIQFAVDGSSYASTLEVTVKWRVTDESEPTDWYAWYIYRTTASTGLREQIHIDTTFAGDHVFIDPDATGEVEYELVRVVNPGTLQETTVSTQVVTLIQDNYWLIDSEDSSNRLMLRNVTADSFADEYESTTMNLLGRGRHIDYGESFGIKGTLTIQFYHEQARVDRDKLDSLKELRRGLYLMNPFGDRILVGIGEISYSRVSGTGRDEKYNIDLPYEELEGA